MATVDSESTTAPRAEAQLDEMPLEQDAMSRAMSWLGFGVNGWINQAELRATHSLKVALAQIEHERDERRSGIRSHIRGMALDRLRVEDEDVGTEKAKVTVLHRRKQYYLSRRAKLHRLTHLFAVAAFCCLLAVPTLGLFEEWIAAAAACGYGLVMFGALLVARQRFRELDEEVVQIDQELDRIKVILQSRQRRALKLLQNHSLELRQYYRQVLRHASFIFWVGVACIILGFAVVGVTLWLTAYQVENDDRYLTAALGLTGTLLANFIAIIYLRMYAATIQSLSTFHNRLVETHRIHFANFLAANVNQGASREQTLASIAMILAGRTPSEDDAALLAAAANGTTSASNGKPSAPLARFGRAR